MGTPDFARESLETIYNAEHEIIGVVTNPDFAKIPYTPQDRTFE